MDLAREQNSRGWSVSLGLMSRPAQATEEADLWHARKRVLREHGVEVLTLSDSTRDVAKAALTLSRWHKNFDIVHSHLLAGVLASRLSYPRAIPLVWTLHATRMGFPNRLIWATQCFVDEYVGCSSAVSQAFQPSIRRPIRTIENGIRLSDFAALESPSFSKPRPFIFITVGALRESKNHLRLVRAAAIARRRLATLGKFMELRVVGEGVQRAAIERAIQELGVEDVVTLCGAKTDIAGLFAESDCFVMSSDVEGLPLALLEALATGLPCVVTPFAFARDQLTHGAEALIASGFTAEALADAMVEVAVNPGEAELLSEGARRAAGRYGIERCSQAYAELYGRLLEA